jgi:hypothetical protein
MFNKFFTSSFSSNVLNSGFNGIKIYFNVSKFSIFLDFVNKQNKPLFK